MHYHVVSLRLARPSNIKNVQRLIQVDMGNTFGDTLRMGSETLEPTGDVDNDDLVLSTMKTVYVRDMSSDKWPLNSFSTTPQVDHGMEQNEKVNICNVLKDGGAKLMV